MEHELNFYEQFSNRKYEQNYFKDDKEAGDSSYLLCEST